MRALEKKSTMTSWHLMELAMMTCRLREGNVCSTNKLQVDTLDQWIVQPKCQNPSIAYRRTSSEISIWPPMIASCGHDHHRKEKMI